MGEACAPVSLVGQFAAGGKALVIAMMFMGRIGPLTLAVAIARRRELARVRHPEGRFLIGWSRRHSLKRKQCGVIGLGRFGAAMAMTLTELGHDVTGVDGDEGRVQELADVISHALQIDATDDKALRSAGIQDVDVAVVLIGENIESSLLVVMQLRELGIQTIVAKAVTPLHGR